MREILILMILSTEAPPNLYEARRISPKHPIVPIEYILTTDGSSPMYIIDFLRSRGVWHEALLYRPAFSSARRAGNAHVPGRSVAKSVLIKAGDSFILAVLPSTLWIDLARLSGVVGAPASLVRLATPAELMATFNDCEPGVVPPFGRLYGLKTFVDQGLAASSAIIFVANTRHEGLRMQYEDFKALEDPVLASFSQPTFTPRREPESFGRDRMVG
jgi:Ala-tRNA(Pro) deacylase